METAKEGREEGKRMIPPDILRYNLELGSRSPKNHRYHLGFEWPNVTSENKKYKEIFKVTYYQKVYQLHGGRLERTPENETYKIRKWY